MRIAFITPDWVPNGGIATHVRLVASALANAGHQLLVLHADAADGVGPPGVELARVRSFSHAASGPHAELAVAEVMEQLFAFRPDVVHVHGAHNVPLEQRVMAEFPTTKTLHVFDFCPAGTMYHHSTDRPCGFRPGLACVPRQAYLRCTLSKRPSVWWSQYRRAVLLNEQNQHYSRMIVASGYVKQSACQSGYDGDRIEVLPYFTAAPVVVTPPPLARHILFVGRLVREKGVDLLLDSLAKLAGEWTCTIVGEGMASLALRAQAEQQGLTGRVRFAGWQSEDDVAASIRDATVVAVPSRWPEPFGIVGIEAMAAGRPVVAFRVGGIPEWLEDGLTGWSVPPADVVKFADRLTRVLEHPAEAEAMGARGRARVEKDFSASAHLRRLLPIYEGLRVRH